MTDIPTDILTDAGFTPEEANTIVEALVKGTSLHGGPGNDAPLNIDDLPPGKKEALEKFNMAVAGDA